MTKEEDISVGEFLLGLEKVQKRASYMYTFNYNNIPCSGLIITTQFPPFSTYLQIRPMDATSDIGSGAGQMVEKKFK